MSNLGMYQKLTEWAKAVGGPKRLIGLLVAGGTALGIGGTIVTQKGIKKIKKKKGGATESDKVYIVLSDGKDDGGFEVRAGDKYRVLSRDADAILVELFGNSNNPHFLSADFLRRVSDFDRQ